MPGGARPAPIDCCSWASEGAAPPGTAGAGCDTPQLYLSYPGAHTDPAAPAKVLRYFQKTCAARTAVAYTLTDRDLSSWDVGQVTDMESMFSGATSFNRQLGGSWSASTASQLQMFNGNGGSIA